MTVSWCMVFLRRSTRETGSSTEADCWKNSPGKRRVVLYTNSAALHWRSLLRAVRILSRIMESESVQWP